MLDVFNFLFEAAEKDENIYFVYVDGAVTRLFSSEFALKHPNRFIKVGIAENNAVSLAAGLAMRGKTVYVIGLAAYMAGRSYEQIRLDVAYNHANVKIIGFISGLSSSKAGYSHWAIDDVNLMRMLPNMTVATPGTENEWKAVLERSLKHKGPMYISYNNGNPMKLSYSVDKSGISTIMEGSDFAIMSLGSAVNEANKLANQMIELGYSPTLLSCYLPKPFCFEKIEKILDQKMPIVTFEEQLSSGGVGEMIASFMAQKRKVVPILSCHVEESEFNFIGNIPWLREKTMHLSQVPARIVSLIKPSKGIVNVKVSTDKKGHLVQKWYLFHIILLLKKRRKNGKDKRYLFGLIRF